MRAGRQRTHLFRDHGKSPPLFAGAGGLDSRVQRQKIGLFGNLRNHIQNLADILRLRFHTLNHFGRLPHTAAKPADAADGVGRCQRPLLRQRLRRTSGLGGFLAVLRYLPARGGHLVHRRGDLFGLALLLGQLLVRVFGYSPHLPHAVAKLKDGLPDA